MAGYNGYSKSNNAIEAEQEGKFPASILAKKLKVKTEAIKALLKPCEWHHTSNWYNRTDYYDMEEALEKLDKLKTFKSEKIVKTYIADVEFVEWSGTRKHPIGKEHVFKNVEVIEKGSYYIFKTQEGEIRKKIGGNGTEVNKIKK
jgi:hypothetical protein